MPIQNGKYVNPGWVNGSAPAINATEMNAISDTLECIPFENGGSGATEITTWTNSSDTVTINKWGRIVLLSFRHRGPAANLINETITQNSYRPIINQHMTCPIYRTESASGMSVMQDRFAQVFVNTSGDISVQLPTGVDAFPRFDMLYISKA